MSDEKIARYKAEAVRNGGLAQHWNAMWAEEKARREEAELLVCDFIDAAERALKPLQVALDLRRRLGTPDELGGIAETVALLRACLKKSEEET